ncbi:MAG: dienelactone hydrolase family protein [Ectothiorhodospiraceae bacterium]|nr:dienelactone hydrolase family protein [Chromatiales bacterium]MCP5154023.1 dienelactone hydrolase family protein [Ectothiorhodospiraceae bacterium]
MEPADSPASTEVNVQTRTPLLRDGPPGAPLTLVLAHGAGAPMDSPFMNAFSAAIADHGFAVARFEFPYMRERRESGKRRPPNPMPVLMETWRTVIAELGDRPIAVGGKSMGGRVASMVADECAARALICLGYPFHPPGRPDRLRIEHLADLRTPTLVCQGERDPFGRRGEVEGYALSPNIALHWLPDGDHGFKPRKASGLDEAQSIRSAAVAAATLLARVVR